MPTAHPTHDMLAAYASGAAGDGAALLVATHATYCAACRAEIARIEAVGAAMLAAEDAEGVDAAALAATLARLDAPAPVEPAAPLARDPILPRPVREAIGGGLRDVRWRFAMPGVSRAEIPVEGPEQAMLLRVRPGCSVPAHTHTGAEATLVLCGALADRGRVYGVGDVALADHEDDHHPRAEPGGDCICLAVMSGGLRFTGRFGRALNFLAE